MQSLSSPPVLALAFGLEFEDLYEHDGLRRLDAVFLAELAVAEPLLAHRLATARSAPDTLQPLQESQLIIDLAPHLEDFIGLLFGIEPEIRALAERHYELAPLFSCKRLFVQRKAVQKYKAAEAAIFDGDALATSLFDSNSISKVKQGGDERTTKT